jgi:filamentous hemagglutinin family protein
MLGNFSKTQSVYPFWIAYWIALCCLVTTSPSQAQIVPDATLPNNSSVTTDGIITGGTVAGKNLFHSFKEFSVLSGSRAYFNNDTAIQNIISRVTGESVSKIDGLIKANNANLFLLNPNGIIFGPNASLDIGGSFLATTASSLKFADGMEFSAKAPQTTPLLTISVPIGLQFGGNAGSIFNQSQATDSSGETVGLQVQPGRTLALVGGDVSLDGGVLTAPGGRVELGGVAGTGTIGLNVGSNNVFLGFPNDPAEVNISAQELSLSFPNNVTKADVSAHKASIEANSIQLQGKQITLTGGSVIGARDFSYLELGKPSITYVTSSKGGNVIINAEKLTVRDGSEVGASSGFSMSRAKLTVTASDSVELSGTGLAVSRYKTRTGFGTPSGLGVGTGLQSTGEELTISTKRLIIRDGAQIRAFAARDDEQSEGTLTINASDSVELTGISTERFGGFIPFNDVSEDGRSISGIFSTVFNVGNAGNIAVNTKRLLIQDGARISASTFSIGKGGTLNINASDSVELNGTSADGQIRSGLFATSTYSDAGSIRIKTGQLSVRNGAQVNVAVEPTARNIELGITRSGQAGNIDIQTNRILLDNQAIFNANSFSGAGGNINLQAEDIFLLRRNSLISATSGNPGNAGQDGNININTQFLIASPGENSDIVATGFGRTVGSNVQVNASRGIFGTQYRSELTPESDIFASGRVTLKAPSIDPSRGLVQLPTEPVNVEVAQGCQASGKLSSATFFNIGRGGLSPNPYEPLSSNHIWEDVPALAQGTDRGTQKRGENTQTPPPDKIVEAQGWIVDEKGEVTLVAQIPSSRSQAGCHLQ